MSTIKKLAKRNDSFKKGTNAHLIDIDGRSYVAYNPLFHISVNENDDCYIAKRLNVREDAIWIYEIYPVKFEFYLQDTDMYKFKDYEKGHRYILVK